MAKQQTYETQSEDLRFTPGRLHKTLADLFVDPQIWIDTQNTVDPRADYANQLERFDEGHVIRGRYQEEADDEVLTGEVFVARAVDAAGESGFVVTVYADPEDGLSDLDLETDEPFTVVSSKESVIVPVTPHASNPEKVSSVEISGLIRVLNATSWQRTLQIQTV